MNNVKLTKKSYCFFLSLSFSKMSNEQIYLIPSAKPYFERPSPPKNELQIIKDADFVLST